MKTLNNIFKLLTKDSKHHVNLIIEGILIGIASGIVVSFYRFLLVKSEETLIFTINFVKGNVYYIMIWFIVLVIMGLIVSYLMKLEPDSKGSGIPQVIAEIKGYINQSWWKVLITKIIGGSFSTIGGLSLGREGPSIQLGAMASKGLSKLLQSHPTDENRFLLAGSGAGIAATFNAPLAGVIFTLEEIDHSFNSAIIIVGLIAAVVADCISKLIFGQATVFSFASPDMPLNYYWLLIFLGILIGFAGYVYNKGMIGASKLWDKYDVPLEVRIVLAFIISGICGFFIPEILAGGHAMLNLLEITIPTLSVLIVLLIGKWLLSILSFSSGAPGGIFFPLLVLGAYIGAIFSAITIPIFGLEPIFTYKIIIISMAAMFTATVRSPLTGVVLITEMTGSANTLVALIIVSIFAYIIPTLLNNEPIYASLMKNILKNKKESKFIKETKPIMINYTIPLNCKFNDKLLNEIPFPKTVLIISITRDNQYLIPNEKTYLKYGDELFVLIESNRYVTDNAKIEKIINEI